MSETIGEIHQYLMDNSVLIIETDAKIISFSPSEISYLEVIKATGDGGLSKPDIQID